MTCKFKHLINLLLVFILLQQTSVTAQKIDNYKYPDQNTPIENTVKNENNFLFLGDNNGLSIFDPGDHPFTGLRIIVFEGTLEISVDFHQHLASGQSADQHRQQPGGIRPLSRSRHRVHAQRPPRTSPR